MTRSEENALHTQSPTTVLKQTGLWQYLNSINCSYANRIATFLEGITPLLQSIVQYFPFYTRHDVIHGEEVIKRIGQILHSDCFKSTSLIALSPSEAFLLIASAYAHDLGMAIFPGEEATLRSRFSLTDDDTWTTNPKLTQYLRDNHSQRGIIYIQENATILGIPQNLVTILGDMMRAHNLSIHELEVQLGKRVAAGEQEIDLKQLACILCVADALEFSDTRVIDGVLEKLKVQTSEAARASYRENMKHVCIGDSVAIGGDGRVVFSGTFREPDVMALAHRTIDITEEWVQQYCDIESSAPKKRIRVKADSFIRNLDLPGVDYERLGIRIKKDNIINLIASNATWSNDVAVPLRELLQNAVEACRYRNHHTPISRGYNPQISVVFDRINHQITVHDNGCGMSKNVVLNNFLTVGNSRSDDPTYRSHGHNSLARFGIGFWSVFTIASDVRVETVPFEILETHHSPEDMIRGLTFSVNIDEFRDYTVFIPVDRHSGTSITLKLKQNIEIDAIIISLKRQIACSPISMKFSVIGERDIDIPSCPLPKKEFELFGARDALAKANDVKVFQWDSHQGDIEIALSLAYREEDGKATFLMKDHQHSMLQLFNINQNTVSVCGFTIPLNLGYMSWDLGRVGHAFVNITNPKGFKYRLDRRTLLPSYEQEITQILANKIIHEGYRQFLKDNDCHFSRDIARLNQESRMHGGEVCDIYTENLLLNALENYPDLLCFKFIEVKKGIRIQDTSVIYVNLDELRRMPFGRIFVCQNLKFTDNRWGDPIQVLPNIYEILALADDIDIPVYVTDPNSEASILFDNSLDTKVHIWSILLQVGAIELYVMEISTNLEYSGQHQWVIAKVTGRWSGTIYERPILSSHDNKGFIFLGRYRLVVKAESRLAQAIRKLEGEGKSFAIAELAAKLLEASNGHIDLELANEWPEIFNES